MDAELIEKVAEEIYCIANSIAEDRNSLPDAWQDWFIELEARLRKCVGSVRALSATPQAAQVPDDDGGRDAALWSLVHIAEKCGAVRSDGGDLHWTFSVDAMYSLEKRMSDAVSAMQYAEAQPQADPWHEAVVAACMKVEGCYQKDDPARTMLNLEGWWYELGKEHSPAELYVPSMHGDFASYMAAHSKDDTARLDFIERTFIGMSDSERYLPRMMGWGRGYNGRTLRQACDKYMAKEAAAKAQGVGRG